MPEFDECYASLRAHHDELDRVQVTHAEMRGARPLERDRRGEGASGSRSASTSRCSRRRRRSCAPRRAPRSGCPRTRSSSARSRRTASAGARATSRRRSRGPTCCSTRSRAVRELCRSCTSCSRGRRAASCSAGLERARDPVRAPPARRLRGDRAGSTTALDAYVVPSRQEGGPKGVLEAMASGVPARDDARRPGDGARRGRRERLARRRRGRRRRSRSRLAHVAAGPKELRRVVAAGRETAARERVRRAAPALARASSTASCEHA